MHVPREGAPTTEAIERWVRSGGGDKIYMLIRHPFAGGTESAPFPTVIVVPVRREFPESAGPVSGWWDVPVPASMTKRRKTYEKEVAPVRRDAVKRS